jgi:hypothetical protein
MKYTDINFDISPVIFELIWLPITPYSFHHPFMSTLNQDFVLVWKLARSTATMNGALSEHLGDIVEALSFLLLKFFLWSIWRNPT